MKVLLCEEDENLALEIKNEIEGVKEKYFDERVEIDIFSSVIELYEYLEHGDSIVDAVFLNMTHSYKRAGDGIKIASQITNDFKNVSIIFYTKQLQLRQELFDIEPLYVLQTPITEKSICTVMQKLSDYVKANRRECFVIKGISALYRIRKDSIIYVESQGRYVHIYTDEEQIVAINKIEQIMEQLGNGFIRCHKSFGVNANKIKKMERSKIVMYNGAEIQISRKYQGNIKEILLSCR